jgi:preprotein translocase subunit SecE
MEKVTDTLKNIIESLKNILFTNKDKLPAIMVAVLAGIIIIVIIYQFADLVLLAMHDRV